VRPSSERSHPRRSKRGQGWYKAVERIAPSLHQRRNYGANHLFYRSVRQLSNPRIGIALPRRLAYGSARRTRSYVSTGPLRALGQTKNKTGPYGSRVIGKHRDLGISYRLRRNRNCRWSPDSEGKVMGCRNRCHHALLSISSECKGCPRAPHDFSKAGHAGCALPHPAKLLHRRADPQRMAGPIEPGRRAT
jgi:hypothetical protein